MRANYNGTINFSSSRYFVLQIKARVCVLLINLNGFSRTMRELEEGNLGSFIADLSHIRSNLSDSRNKSR